MHGHEAIHPDGLYALQHQPNLPWWMQLFSLDQGAEHLEHFRQNRESAAETSDFWVFPVPNMTASYGWLLLPVEQLLIRKVDPILLVARGFAGQHGLRGPPMA